MKTLAGAKLAAVALLSISACGVAQAEDLDSFAILAGSTITNTGPSVINGNIGVSPGTAVTGFFSPGIVTAPYTIHANDGVAIQAQIDLVARYVDLANRPATRDLTGQDLAGLTLAPGVYAYDTSAQLSGTLTLDAQNNPNAVFIIDIGSTLITSSGANVALVNGAQGGNVFFVVGSSATIGTDTTLAGQILALTSITLNTGADITCGAALARNGAVTLDTNTISVCTLASVPIGTVITPTGGTPVVTPPGGTPGTTPVGTRAPTANELAVASGIDAYVAGGGRLQAVFRLLTPAQLLVVLDQISGEIGTSVAPAGAQAMTSFLTQVFDRVNGEQGPLADTFGSPRPAPEEEMIPPGERFGNGQPTGPSRTVRALGYGPDDAAPLAAMAVLQSRETATPLVQPVSRPWTAWISGYGETARTDGDNGAHDRNIDTAGFAGGIDYRIAPDALIGFALGAGSTEFGLSGGNGYGSNDTIQASIYGRKDFDAAYVAAVIGASYNDVSTERDVTIGTTDRYSADFSAYDIAGRIEAGYRFDVPDPIALPGTAWLTPYASLQVQSFFTPSYTETSSASGALFALDYDSDTSTTTRTELGARFGRTIAVDPDTQLRLRGRLAWAHDDGSDAEVETRFENLPGSDFSVTGADQDDDSLLASAGVEVRFTNGLAVGGFFDSKLSDNSQSYSGTGRLSYSW